MTYDPMSDPVYLAKLRQAKEIGQWLKADRRLVERAARMPPPRPPPSPEELAAPEREAERERKLAKTERQAAEARQGVKERERLLRARRKLAKQGVRLPERPWSALTKSQRENRLDTLAAWHEREIFTDDLCGSPDKRIAAGAQRATEAEMRVMVRAFKMGIDLSLPGIVSRLSKAQDWSRFVAATDADTELAMPPSGGLFRSLDRLVESVKTSPSDPVPEPGEKVSPANETSGKTLPQDGAQPIAFSRIRETAADGEPASVAPEPATPKAQDPAEVMAEENEPSQSQGPTGPKNDESEARTAEIEAIRAKLMINGKVRLDVEALAVYMMCPSYFAIATGLDPEPWQAQFLDDYSLRLGCLAARQSGKSLVTARKAVCFAMCNPATTTLILAPTMRQSSELLLKIMGICSIAGLKLASSNQFGIVLAEKQAGAASRVVCLPGSNEDSGASVRGYSADLLIFEEAAFLGDAVISAVLPSIAARPKAQLVGISSAGIIGSYFHSVMTSPQSRWTKIVVPAAELGRFSAEQLESQSCRSAPAIRSRWTVAGARSATSIYTDDVMSAAFGTQPSRARARRRT